MLFLPISNMNKTLLLVLLISKGGHHRALRCTNVTIRSPNGSTRFALCHLGQLPSVLLLPGQALLSRSLVRRLRQRVNLAFFGDGVY